MGESAEAPSPRTPRLLCLFSYAFTALAAFAFPVVGYRLDLVSLRAPLVYESNALMFNDTLLILPMVQATLEGGTHWKADRLGFPGVQHMHDFPVVDHFHFAWLWLIGQITGSTILTFNIYYLLGYPLAAVSMLAVLRHFGISYPAGMASALLYSSLPYHQFRGENHYFLSAYYLVPIICMVMISVCQGRLPFFRKDAGGKFRFSLRGDTLFAAILMLVTGSAGAYYAFFACGLFAIAGLYGWFYASTWRAAASAAILIAFIILSGLLNHLPMYLYHQEFGTNTGPVARYPEESEYYGLKLAQLLLPIDDHKLRSVSDFKSIYNSYLRPVQADTERYSLGSVVSLGFIGLMLRLLLPLPRSPLCSALASLTAFAVAIGVVGGLGSIFNQTITPSVRCYNRIAIYIATFSVIALAAAGDWLMGRTPQSFRWLATFSFWGGVLWFGLWDMTPYQWGTLQRAQAISANQYRYFRDAKFFQQIEAAMNPEGVTPGPAIFELPYVMWPESPTVHQLGAYEHARGYLHTKTLRWSFGCMKGRETDVWYRSVAVLAPNAIAPMLDRITRAGFEGILLDKRGYTPAHAAQVEQQLLKMIAGSKPIRNDDGTQIFFDLRRHRDDIRQGRDWQAEQYRETHRPCILWLDGFVSYREPGYEWLKRWCGPCGTALFVNPSDETKTITCTFKIFTEFREPSKLTIDGGAIWSETMTIDKKSESITRTFVIPPGRHTIKFNCEPPATHIPNDYRRLTFIISGLKFD